MTRYISPADTAKEIRKAFKISFPGQKFSVRTSVYAGGASIDISYVDGPSEKAVEAVAKQFAGANFDGMTDSMSYHHSQYNGEEVSWGANFVFVNQRFSPEVEAEAKAFVKNAIYGENGTVNENRFYEVPQEIYSRASVVNGGKYVVKGDTSGHEYFSFSARESNIYSMACMVSAWIVAEKAQVPA